MAFERKNWLNRQSEFPNRRKFIQTEIEDVYDVVREEGLVVELGDAFNADNMNNLEQRIVNEFERRNSTIIQKVLSASNWTNNEAPYNYNLFVEGVTNESVQEILLSVDVTLEQIESAQDANIQDAGQSTNTIFLKAWGYKPEVDIPIRIIMRSDL